MRLLRFGIKQWILPLRSSMQLRGAFNERKHYRLLEQIESCSTSVAMNIAEGKGRYSKKEYMQYLYISRGSLYETMTLLEILRRKKWISDDDFHDFEHRGKEIAAMIKGLIKAIGNQLKAQR